MCDNPPKGYRVARGETGGSWVAGSKVVLRNIIDIKWMPNQSSKTGIEKSGQGNAGRWRVRPIE